MEVKPKGQTAFKKKSLNLFSSPPFLSPSLSLSLCHPLCIPLSHSLLFFLSLSLYLSHLTLSYLHPVRRGACSSWMTWPALRVCVCLCLSRLVVFGVCVVRICVFVRPHLGEGVGCVYVLECVCVCECVCLGGNTRKLFLWRELKGDIFAPCEGRRGAFVSGLPKDRD